MKTSFLGKCRYAVLGLAAAVLLLPSVVSAATVPTTTGLAISPNPANDGDTVTITGTTTFTSSGLPVVGEMLQIQIRQSDTSGGYNPALGVACDATIGPSGGFIQVPPENSVTDANGQVSKTLDTTGLAGKVICFMANHPAGGSPSFTSHSQSAGFDLVIESSCTGVTLTNPSVSGGTMDADGSARGPWTVKMDLKNCLGQSVAFKVQGGANAWAPYNDNITVTSGTTDFKVNKKNTVIIWNVTTSGTETITFGVGSTSSVVPCGAVPITQYLSGNWSAAYVDPNTGLPAKSDYTARATVSSDVCSAP